MRNGQNGAIPSDLGDLIDDLDDIERRLRILEAPSGEALSSAVAKLRSLVEDIQAQLDAWAAGRWTNSQITTEVNNRIATTLAGDVTVGGQFKSINAYNTDITWTRRTAWLGNDGRLGYASSSRDKKMGIEPADEARLAALLDIVPKSFFYRAEIARRTSLRINEGVDYVPPREVGLIAEELDEAGLHEFVIYDEEGKPEGIEYGMLVVALLAVDRTQRAELDDIRARLDRIESGS